MFTIILTICSVVQGATCKQAELTYADENQAATPYGCMIGGMIEVSKWQASHPNWRVHRWQCGRAGMYAKA